MEIKYIIGFDPDTKASGVMFFNKRTGEGKSSLKTYVRLTEEYMPSLEKQLIEKGIPKSSLLIRIELPTLQTARGAGLRDSAGKKIERAFHSGRCMDVAEKFYDYCVYKGFSAIMIKSDRRVRCTRKDLSGASISTIVRKGLELHKRGLFLSKLDERRFLQLFPSYHGSFVNSEIIDAALLIPEYLMHQYSKIK